MKMPRLMYETGIFRGSVDNAVAKAALAAPLLLTPFQVQAMTKIAS
jgi:hypothetical protein